MEQTPNLNNLRRSSRNNYVIVETGQDIIVFYGWSLLQTPLLLFIYTFSFA